MAADADRHRRRAGGDGLRESAAGAMIVALSQVVCFGTMARMFDIASTFRRRAAIVIVGVASLFACGNRSDATRTTPPEPPMENRASTATFGLRTPVIATGDSHTCALLDDGHVKCWGLNRFGQLGLGDVNNRGGNPGEMGDALAVIDLGTRRTALAIAAGNEFTCALLDNHSVKCWGDNRNGQLGLGDNVDRGADPGEMGDALPAVELGSDRTALAIAVGGDQTCAILDNHHLKCWGGNALGQLGLGDKVHRGDDPAEMGDVLPTVDLGTGRTALAIAAGDFHTCALLDNHSVKCWGDNAMGVLGLGDTQVRGDQPGEMGDALPAVDLGAGRTTLSISLGSGHACAILDNDSVKCWGNNGWGQLGVGDMKDRGGKPDEMADALAVIDLGEGRVPIAITLGEWHTCALLDDKSVKCWGGNNYGQLGLGDMEGRGGKRTEMGDVLLAVNFHTRALCVAAGVNHTCAVLDEEQVKCWGRNDSGQLGLGDTNNRGEKSDEMGDALPVVQLE